MTDAQWYEDMAAAMKERDKCVAALERWATALQEAEAKIKVLRESPATAPSIAIPTVANPETAEEAEPNVDWPRN